MLNLDTHILVFALAGTLTPKERAILDSDQWGISAIVLWELTKLSELGRIELDIDSSEVEELLSSLDIWPIDLAVCRATLQLDFDSDPADEIIAATSIVRKAPLVTRDRKMRASKIVPLASTTP